MPPQGTETNQPAPEHPKENKGLIQRLRAMLTGGNPDNTPEMKAKLEAARAANNAPQEQTAADRVSYMQAKVDSGEVPVVSPAEVQTGQTPAVSSPEATTPAVNPQTPETPQNPAV